MKAGKAFYAVLNMGLGHATRSLPVIQALLKRGWQVMVGSNGRSLSFLQRELPTASFVETPDYGIRYSRSGFLLPRLALQIPRLLRGISQERDLCRRVLSQFRPDVILSDHCYGICSPEIPSYFISHQIRFAMPTGLNFLGGLPARFNFHFHRQFTGVIIPDQPAQTGGLISGELSRIPPSRGKYHYVGPLSSVAATAATLDIDALVSISGPEPQRTVFEERVLQQIDNVPGRKVVVLGKSESIATVVDKPNLVIKTHVPRKEMQELMNRARILVSRPGYSTLMELAELGKQALLVPTPGQTEQLYLARRARENGWWYPVDQKKLNLVDDLARAAAYPGLSLPGVSRKSVENILAILENDPGGADHP